ncbi:conserved hypothetical protein [Neospora caninum Liverpool]|uniref:Uncharacterized protein n=1 Tax=Neospora caninum (strain Liverpool) TaxID=572307 RepID=F0VLT7_NEOCL|nr:conserved hypothetical protein [Neospora caninum Liverpool]CBZ54215.1 conserved hypothetical protein [Neospora caninum Liverpool]CEL68916.1 TPA: hypothetical protein BN1204_046470 [Neospora caninum Liverpool]|eukprot:XP_003884246.1 conserved hypothetical protein [Neospora caninum Liverpool]
MCCVIRKKTAPNEICWLNKVLRRLVKKVSREHRVDSGGTETTHLTVDRDGQVRDHLGQAVPCYDNASSVCHRYSRAVSSGKLMSCLYFHSESSKGKNEDVRYTGSPPLIGAPLSAVLDGLPETRSGSAARGAAAVDRTASVDDLDLQRCTPPKPKRESSNISRQTTASSAC